MPAPTGEQIQAIIERMQEAIVQGMPEPQAHLTAEQHTQLVDLFFHGGSAALVTADVTERHLREFARTMTGEHAATWRSPAARNRINFRTYQAAARQRRVETDAAIEAADNVTAMEANGGRRRRRNTSLSIETPADMVDTQSTLLITLGLLAQHRAGRCWYDSFHKRHFTDWHGDDDGTVIDTVPMDDAFERRVMQWLHSKDSRLARISESQAHSYLLTFAEQDQRNEPRDWLTSQVWDGVPRLRELFTRGFGAADTNFNTEAGRCWIVSMVARIMVPGSKVDTMPVLIGGQGLFKSSALERIGGAWYRAASSGIDSKDFLQELHGTIVFEIPELHSIISSRHGAAVVKAKLSIREDHFRLSYGRLAQTFKRTAVWVGTTNNRDWHTDETGGRRFWPVHVGTLIDLDWISDNRAQLFAEALTYYNERKDALVLQATGEDVNADAYQTALHNGAWWNVPADEQEALINNETLRHGWHDIIETRLMNEVLNNRVYRGLITGEVYNARTLASVPGRVEPGPRNWDGTLGDAADWGTLITTHRIGLQWLGLPMSELGRGGVNIKTISGIMRTLGYESKLVRIPRSTQRVYAWVLSCLTPEQRANARNINVASYDMTDMTVSETGEPEDENGPF